MNDVSNTEKEKKEGILSKIKKVKHIEIIVALVAVAIMLIIYFSSFFNSSSSNSKSGNENPSASSSVSYTTYSDYCLRMKDEITRLVSSMEGAGDAVVSINWESSVELILAKTENSSSNSNSSSPIIISSSGSSQPIILKEIYPKALGVIIVCKGGGDAKVRLYITMAVSTLLQIPSEKIAVYAMN